MVNGKHEFKVYVRHSCHLCDDLLLVLNEYLESHLVPYSLDVIDITDDVELEEKYGQLVPVLHESGNEICHYFFDVNRWNEYFSSLLI